MNLNLNVKSTNEGIILKRYRATNDRPELAETQETMEIHIIFSRIH